MRESTRKLTTKKGKKKAVEKKARGPSAVKGKSGHRWVADVHTESTYPTKGLFNKSAATIARSLASKETSPKGPASGMRMLNYYINRAGQNLSASRKAELEKAKSILSDIIARQKTKDQKRGA